MIFQNDKELNYKRQEAFKSSTFLFIRKNFKSIQLRINDFFFHFYIVILSMKVLKYIESATYCN